MTFNFAAMCARFSTAIFGGVGCRRRGAIFQLKMGQKASSSLKTVPREGKLLRPAPKFTPDPFQYLEELELRIERLTNMGDGVARLDGWVIMVPHTIPGELVRARVHRNHKNYSEATLVSVVEPSPERTQPQCKLFGLCGGCQYQHMSIKAQREWKREQVRSRNRSHMVTLFMHFICDGLVMLASHHATVGCGCTVTNSRSGGCRCRGKRASGE
jgi:predicted RNA-binding protein with TRAM domain